MDALMSAMHACGAETAQSVNTGFNSHGGKTMAVSRAGVAVRGYCRGPGRLNSSLTLLLVLDSRRHPVATIGPAVVVTHHNTALCWHSRPSCCQQYTRMML